MGFTEPQWPTARKGCGMYRQLTRPVWFVLAFAVLVAGGLVTGISLVQQEDAREQLVQLEIADHNLRRAAQSRVDDLTGRRSISHNDGSEEALEVAAARMRELTDRADEELEELQRLLDQVGTTGNEHFEMRSIDHALMDIRAASWKPVQGQQRDAGQRVTWSLVLTGVALAVLLIIEVRRPES